MTEGNDSLITEELRGWIGRTTPLRPLEVLTVSDIRRYVEATGDANPLWLDDEFARSMGYHGRPLPPLLVGWVPFSIKEDKTGSDIDSTDLRRQLPLPKNYNNVRNAGAEFEWLQPAYLGEQLSFQMRILDIVARQGRAVLGIYVTREEQVLNPKKETVLVRRQTIVIFPETKFSNDPKNEGGR